MPNYAGAKGKKRYINKAKRQRPTAVVQSSNGALGFMATLTRSHLAKKKERNINYKKYKEKPKAVHRARRSSLINILISKLQLLKRVTPPEGRGARLRPCPGTECCVSPPAHFTLPPLILSFLILHACDFIAVKLPIIMSELAGW